MGTIELNHLLYRATDQKLRPWGLREPVDIGTSIELTMLVPVKKFPSEKKHQAIRRARQNRNMTPKDKKNSAIQRHWLSTRECFYCGEFKEQMQIEHYFPLAKGGTDHMWNLYSACKECNNAKGTQCGTYFLLRTGK